MFKICKASHEGEPDRPPAGALPTVDAPPIVQYPEPSLRTGLGWPGGAYGKPWCEIGRARADDSFFEFYNSLFPSTSSGSATVKVNLLDTRAGTPTWKVYYGIMWRPTFTAQSFAGTHPYNSPRIMITELETTVWSEPK